MKKRVETVGKFWGATVVDGSRSEYRQLLTEHIAEDSRRCELESVSAVVDPGTDCELTLRGHEAPGNSVRADDERDVA